MRNCYAFETVINSYYRGTTQIDSCPLIPNTIISVGLITGPNPADAYYHFGPASKVHSTKVPMPSFHRGRLSVIFP